ncbi:MAG: histidinol-phosphatase [bacterium]|nr:histidinol-phosphatase [bacterium]
MKELYDFALELAGAAGKNTLKYFRQEFEIEKKADSSPVTIADRSTEELLRTEIEKRFPDDGIVGEEFGVKEGRSGRRWILDPIDGTKSFVRGFPCYGNMIAVVDGDEPAIGVVNFPAMSEMVSAMVGEGCYYNGEHCQVSDVSSAAAATVLSSDFRDIARRWGEKPLIELFERTGLQRTWGDCYGYMMLAVGRADVMIDAYLHIWDVAALIPVVTEAGGLCTTLEGECKLEADHLFASNALIHAELLEIMQSNI